MRVSVFPVVEPRARRIAIGTFDGVHLGHHEVISGCDTVLTFDPHPLAVIRPDAVPALLTDLAEKVARFAALGVAETVLIPFDHDFAARTAENFVDQVLVEALGATHVSVGENFRFGCRAAGDTALLVADRRFETRVVPLRTVDGEPVSSTRIRRLLAVGARQEASRLLGRPPTSARSAPERLEEPSGRL
jgi:riboflavin kinase / FMN adenylyltransferase